MPVCSHCGYRGEPGPSGCPLCGAPMEADGGRAGSGGAASGRRLTPWDREGPLSLSDFWASLRDSFLRPGRFFRSLDYDRGGWSRPLLFFLLLWIAGEAFQLFWVHALAGALAEELGELGRLAPLVGSPSEVRAKALFNFFISPFKALLFLGAFGAMTHALVALLGSAGRRRGFGATARVICYSGGPRLLLAVPALGRPASVLWSLFLVAAGLRAAHGLSRGRAAAVVLVPFLVVGGLVFVAALLLLLPSMGAALS